MMVIIFLGFLLWRSLSENPHLIPSPFINKAAPAFRLPSLFHSHEIITQQIFTSHLSVVNVFASWCFSCRAEHSAWMDFHRQYPTVQLMGVLFKDHVKAAKQFLQTQGNPYHVVLNDSQGDFAINYGVYGVPETFIIDQAGIVRRKIIGVVSPSVLDQAILPLMHASPPVIGNNQ